MPISTRRKEPTVTITCPIICVASSQQLMLDSGHSRLIEPRANEFVVEIDIESNEAVGFQIADFSYAGNDYTVSVTAVRNGVNQTWTRSDGICTSPIEDDEVEVDINVMASAPGVTPLIGGGAIRVLPMGKPD
jgi:hypothetical protein